MADDDVYLRVCARTDVGRVRENNEDAFVVADLDESDAPPASTTLRRLTVGKRGVLLAVSDGMGGARAGEVASRIVVDSLRTALIEAAPTGSRGAILTSAVERAHRAVQEAALEKSRRGMGATLTAVLVRGSSAYIAEVGDSR